MSRYFAGWDGGGSKTSIVCIAPDGTILLQAETGALNINGNDIQQARNSLSQALGRMAALPGGLDGCAGLCIAAAGVSSGAQGALFSAFGTQPGMVLIAGTGSICYGQDAHGRTVRCGGYGYLIDDEGSGYAIGRDMLAAIVRAEDGRTAPTALHQAVFQTLQLSRVEELVGFLYGKSTDKKDVAALAPLCAATARQGDEAASAILDKAARALYTLAVTAAGQLRLPAVGLALSGSVLTKMQDVRQRLETLLKQSGIAFSVCSPAINAAYGAARMAQSKFAKEDTHG